MMDYGQLPIPIGQFNIKCEEIFFYQYLPIKLPHDSAVLVPDRLKIFFPLLHAVVDDIGEYFLYDKYIYITAKHVYVTPEYWGNRPGYHTDGFMTNDINYIWSDCNPTIFNSTSFEITQDHIISLSEFEMQASKNKEVTYPNNFLLKLNEFVVHKVSPVTKCGFRTFVKISVSDEKYNLKGNTHNYLLDYNWKMVDRSTERNDPTKK